MELRSFIRRYIPEKNSIRVLAKNGDELIGYLLDLNQKGFRLSGKKKFQPGALLEGLMQYDSEEARSQVISFSARCVWVEAREAGFSIKEIPVAHETVLDQFIEQLAGKS